MTKRFEFSWQIPVPEPLLQGCIFDRWTEEKDSSNFEPRCMFKVDQYGFFIYWKSEPNVSLYSKFIVMLHTNSLKPNVMQLLIISTGW